MRIAIVHDWLTGMRGGEKVLSLLCELFPRADLYTLIHVRGACDRRIEAMPIRTSFLNDLAGVARYYRYLLPLMPLAIERFNLEGYDLVVSCSHCVAKGVLRSERSAHLCYCLTPMRYIWSQEEVYRRSLAPRAGCSNPSRATSRVGSPQRLARGPLCRQQPPRCRANPAVLRPHLAGRAFAGRCFVLSPSDEPREDYYLMVTALSPYKRVDQAVAAFVRMGRPLRIIGEGPMRRELQALRCATSHSSAARATRLFANITSDAER